MAESKFSALRTRIITGFILICIVGYLWSIGSVGMFLLVCVLSALGQLEFCNMFMPDTKQKEKYMAVLIGFIYILLTFSTAIDPFALVLLAFLCFATYGLKNFNQENALDNLKIAAIMFISFMYVTVIFTLLLDFTPAQQALIVAIPIVSDTTAYFGGNYCGKTKIWPTVSPKKTLEGCLVGHVGSFILIMIVALKFEIFSTNSALVLIPVAIFLGVMTQLGDFFESALKRSVNVKDSGALLPGHGGILDRTDSLLFTIASFEICRAFLG